MKSTASHFSLKLSPRALTAICLLLLLITFTVLTLRHRPRLPRDPLRFHPSFLSSATNATLSAYLRSLTRHPHLAGTPPSLSTARFVLSHFQSFGLETQSARFRTLLSYPLDSSLSLHFPNGSAFSLPLGEPGSSGVVLPYHAYSPSGSVSSTAVFANYGREEDYKVLIKLGVDVNGSVVVVRKGDDLSRGGVVRMAERAGAAAVLIYAEEDKTVKSGVERGTVIRGVGDPLSPGWAVDADNVGEVLGLEDTEVSGRYPRIPSLPVSLECAEKILGKLGGAPLPSEWKGSVRSTLWGVGPGPVVLNLTYQVWSFSVNYFDFKICFMDTVNYFGLLLLLLFLLSLCHCLGRMSQSLNQAKTCEWKKRKKSYHTGWKKNYIFVIEDVLSWEVGSLANGARNVLRTGLRFRGIYSYRMI